VTSTSATFIGLTSEDGQHALSGAGITWGYQPDLSDGTDVAASLGAIPLTISVDLTGLTLVTDTVYWSAYAENSEGRAYGDTLKVKASPPACAGLTTVTFDDYDYDLVEIGNQCWFAENLRSDNYLNGDPIPQLNTDMYAPEWEDTQSGAQAIHWDLPANLADKGRLYNSWAVVDSRGLCPSGWHVPRSDEYAELINFLGGSSIAGTALKASPADSPNWDGDNASGFSGLLGGFIYAQGYSSFSFDAYGEFWTTTNTDYVRLASGSSAAWTNSGMSNEGRSVRCLKD
jgi:uncharacterized protein (TIGR02145 family)